MLVHTFLKIECIKLIIEFLFQSQSENVLTPCENASAVNYSYAPTIDDNIIYFVNFVTTNETQHSLYEYDTLTGDFSSARVEDLLPLSFIVPVNKNCSDNDENRYFAVGSGTSVFLIVWKRGSNVAKVIRKLFGVNDAMVRFDIGVTDSKGRLYAATLCPTFCPKNNTIHGLYRYDNENGVVRIGNTQSATGIVFSGTFAYVLDTCSCHITEYDYSIETGDLSLYSFWLTYVEYLLKFFLN